VITAARRHRRDQRQRRAVRPEGSRRAKREALRWRCATRAAAPTPPRGRGREDRSRVAIDEQRDMPRPADGDAMMRAERRRPAAVPSKRARSKSAHARHVDGGDQCG
jgi:hypothetical protein